MRMTSYGLLGRNLLQHFHTEDGRCKFFQNAGIYSQKCTASHLKYEGWNFNSGNYLFTTDTKQIHVSKLYCPSM